MFKHAIKRQLSVLAYAWGSLQRRRGRTLAVSVAFVFVVAAFTSVFLLAESLRAEADRGMAYMPDLTVSMLRAGRPALMSAEQGDHIRGIPGVGDVEPRVWGYVYVEGVAANLTVTGTRSLPSHMDEIVQGSLPAPGATGWIMVGEGVTRTLGLLEGDTLGIDAPNGAHVDLTLTAVFRSASAVRTADVALMAESDARRLLGLGTGEATDIAVSLTNLEESSTVARKISALLPGARVVERRTMRRAYDLTWGTRGGLLAIMFLPALLALLILAWDRATGLSPADRYEIGVLKLVGWSQGQVVAIKLWESVIVAGVCSLTGVVLAYVYVFVARAPGMLQAVVGWSSFHGDFRLVPASGFSTLVAVSALSSLPYLVASVIPAWRTAVIDPGDVMRAG